MYKLKASAALENVIIKNGKYFYSGVKGCFTPEEWQVFRDAITENKSYEIVAKEESDTYMDFVVDGESTDILSGLVEEYIDYTQLKYICKQFKTHEELSAFVNDRMHEGFYASQIDINTLALEMYKVQPKVNAKTRVKD